ncbi:hypothetical protein E1288_30090, partial [Saccharopolyspora elongata]
TTRRCRKLRSHLGLLEPGAVKVARPVLRGDSAPRGQGPTRHTRFVLAECATAAKVARVFLDSCIQQHLAGQLDASTAAMAKWWLTEQQCQVVDKCLQLFGGYGYMREYPIARMFADARIQKIYGGTNEIMKEIIARTL